MMTKEVVDDPPATDFHEKMRQKKRTVTKPVSRQLE
jgi:hypothetical protein